jgi:hypothetical protein
VVFAPDRRQVRLVFRRLLTAEGARALIGRGELESSLDGSSAAAVAAAVIDRLLAARLIVSRDDDTGDRIEIIHETLATTWPRLAAWRREDAAGARLGEQLAVAARHWNERGRPADLLWRGDALSDLGRWQRSGDHGATPVERAFTRASIASAARVRRTRIGIVASAFALLVAGVIGLVSANRKIADQRAAAVDRLSASFEERGRVAIGDGDDARGLLYLAEASRLGARGPDLDLLASHAAASLDAGLASDAMRAAGRKLREIAPGLAMPVVLGVVWLVALLAAFAVTSRIQAERIAAERDIASIFVQIPSERISPVASRFAQKILEINRQRLLALQGVWS